MWKYKTQYLTGIFGLAFGLACFIPALYWWRYETSYDSFYPASEHIYRFYTVDKQTGKVNELVSGILERKLHEQFAATDNSTLFFSQQNDCSAEGMPHIRLRTLFTDSAFFNVFPQAIISGDARQPLETVNNMVITETMAMRLFGDAEKAIGQQMKSALFHWSPPYTVTAVVKDPPSNTNLPFDAILNFDEIRQHKVFVERTAEQIWTFATLQGYIKFHPHTDISRLAELLRDFPSQLDANANMELRLMPVSDIRHRLNADVPFTMNFIRLFVASGILLMFSALFNFLNLHLNHFRQRIREMRQRTVHGAKSRQLIAQMLFEMSCSILLALIISCFLVILTCPLFAKFLGVSMEMLLLIYLFMVCGTGVMALMIIIGLIPFWRMSYLVIKQLSKRKIHPQPISHRMAVTFQLAVSVVFIVASLVVMMQMRFVSHKDLGFDRNGIIRLSGLNWHTNRDVLTVLKNELSSIPQIESITDTYFEPQHEANTFNSEIKTMTTDVEWPGKEVTDNPFFQTIVSDSRFAETFRVKIMMGKWLDETGEHHIVLNEEAVRVMGLNDPIGVTIRLPSYDNPKQEYIVVGVVKDFHTLSLRSRIFPTLFFTSPEPTYSFYLRAVPGQELAAIQRINAILPKIDASLSEVYPTPINELYDRLNYSEQAGLKMFSVLAVICLLISLFGIYAVATAATRRRRKEIAIRKVVGAEVIDIIRLFFREYTMQVIMAGVVALPLASFAMHRWLQGYAYRTNIPWWLLAGVMTSVVAFVLLTVLGQVWKAANRNPADVVKSE